MEREHVNEDFVWKRLDCAGAMVNHLGSSQRMVMGLSVNLNLKLSVPQSDE